MWSNDWLIAFAYWTFLLIFKMVSFFDHYLLFRAVLCTEQLQCLVETFLACFFFSIFNFWHKVITLQRLSPLLGGRCSQCLEWSHFSKISCFSSRFRIYQLECLLETFLACCFAFLIFHLKCRFCTGQSLCLVAVFSNVQNGLIFPIFFA